MTDDEYEKAGAAALAEALLWVGTPYRHQGSARGVGCDCLGLVRGVWRTLYGREPEVLRPYSADWAEAGGNDALLDAARRHCREMGIDRVAGGTLLVFRWRRSLPAKHLGIALSRTRFVHAYEGHAVTVSSLVPQWRRRIAGCFAFPPLPTI